MDPRAAAIILAASVTASDTVRSGETPIHPGAVDDLRARLAEVEERLDFQERLLAQGAPWGLPPERNDA